MKFRGIVVTVHARKRAALRGIDLQQISRELLTLPYEEGKQGRYYFVGSKRYVVYQDRGLVRKVITVI